MLENTVETTGTIEEKEAVERPQPLPESELPEPFQIPHQPPVDPDTPPEPPFTPFPEPVTYPPQWNMSEQIANCDGQPTMPDPAKQA